MKKADVKLDPVKYEVFYNKLDQALNEAYDVVRYLSGSVIVREVGEALEAFYLPDGSAVDISCGLLMHFMTVTRAIRYMNANRYKEVGIGIYEGDQFMQNEAYIGGMHCPDTVMIKPVFYKGNLEGYVAAVSHTTEIGAIEPGGMPTSATEAWHDGFHVPAVKIVERGEPRRDVWNMLLRSTRDPRTLELDLRARMAGNVRANQRMLELIEEFGIDFFRAACRRLVKDGNDFFQNKLRKLRPGVYTSSVYVDTLGGIQPPELALIQVSLEVTKSKNRKLIMRIPMVSPQKACYNNAYLPATEGSLFYTLITNVLYDARWNSGMADSIIIEEIPKSSRLNADPTQSVAYATIGIACNLAAAICECLSRIYYTSGIESEVQAQCGGNICDSVNSGIRKDGTFFSNIMATIGEPIAGGGTTWRDGWHNYHFTNPFRMVPDTEGEEILTCTLHLLRDFVPDSGGYGKFRGGTASIAISSHCKSLSAAVTGRGSGSRIPSNQGMFGGYPGNTTHIKQLFDTNVYELAKEGKPLLWDADDSVDPTQKVEGKLRICGASSPCTPMKSGDIWTQLSAGGGGLGDPIERDPQLIVSDIQSNQATLERARKVYCVSIDLETLEINYEETKKMREQKKQERLDQGIPARKYLKRLVAKRKNGKLPPSSLAYIKEMTAFAPEFAKTIEAEEEFSKGKSNLPRNIKIKKVLFKLTPYINVVQDTRGRRLLACSYCGHVYCDADENYKLYSLVYERDPMEMVTDVAPVDKDWGLFREFYCPGCGAQTEVECTPPGAPVWQSYQNISTKI